MNGTSIFYMYVTLDDRGRLVPILASYRYATRSPLVFSDVEHAERMRPVAESHCRRGPVWLLPLFGSLGEPTHPDLYVCLEMSPHSAGTGRPPTLLTTIDRELAERAVVAGIGNAVRYRAVEVLGDSPELRARG